jgi:hypothetical protein
MKMAAAGREVYAGPQERCLTSVWRRIHEAGDKLFGSWFAEMIGRETAQHAALALDMGDQTRMAPMGFPPA